MGLPWSRSSRRRYKIVPGSDTMNVFEIERYATEDGPGIRTVLFLKGCNLRCIWCQNPESQQPQPQIMYSQKKCAACETCVHVCPTAAVSRRDPFGYVTDHDKCILCGECVDRCFYGARQIIGEKYTVEDLLKEIMKDKTYYDESGGGVTVSGGEPLLQFKELNDLLFRLKDRGVHTALETAGFVDWRIIENISRMVDLFYFDFKHIDSQLHEKYTGVPNELILENLKKLSYLHKNLVIRIPVIPGINEKEEILGRMFNHLVNETGVRQVELLPYHRLGMGKYHGLGWEYEMGDIDNLSREDCEAYAEIGRRLGLEVRVGAS